MIYLLLNHIQGENGSRWAQFVKDTGTDHMLIVAIDAAKYTHKAAISTFMEMYSLNHLNMMHQYQDLRP